MEQSKGFTKENTLVAKGVAIVFMLLHHLFAFPNRIKQGDFFSLIHIGNIDLLLGLSYFGNVCIGIYIFLSGIGAYHKYNKNKQYTIRNSTKGIFTFLCRYWLIFLLFVPIGFVFFRIPFSLKELLENLFCIGFTYNSEWWFVSLYIELMLFFPLYRKLIDQYPIKGVFVSGVVAILGFGIKQFHIINIICKTASFGGVFPHLMYEIEALLLWQFIFTLGYICAKYKWYYHLTSLLHKYSLDCWYVYLTAIILMITGRNMLPIEKLLDPLIVPFFILSIVRLIEQLRVQKVFAYLGKHSINIWLVHTFFCYKYLQRIIYLPRYAPVILLWLLVLCVFSSVIINFILNLSRNCLKGNNI